MKDLIEQIKQTLETSDNLTIDFSEVDKETIRLEAKVTGEELGKFTFSIPNRPAPLDKGTHTLRAVPTNHRLKALNEESKELMIRGHSEDRGPWLTIMCNWNADENRYDLCTTLETQLGGKMYGNKDLTAENPTWEGRVLPGNNAYLDISLIKKRPFIA